MTVPDVEDLAALDQLVEQTDNSGEEGQPDPPQTAGWRPWSDGPV